MQKLYVDKYYEIDLKGKEFELLNKAISSKCEKCSLFIEKFLNNFRNVNNIDNLLGLLTIPEDEKVLVLSWGNLKSNRERKEIYFDEKEMKHYVLDYID